VKNSPKPTKKDRSLMLEALKEIASCECPCEPVGTCLKISNGVKDLRCVVCIARAAVAVAEGRG